jgi:hypothetical protein
MESPILKCKNPKCDPGAKLRQFEVRSAKMSIWQCPRCRFLYFYHHVEKLLSEGLKPKA